MAPGAGWAERGQGTFCRCNDFMLISIIMITATLLGLATTVWPLPRDGVAAACICVVISSVCMTPLVVMTGGSWAGASSCSQDTNINDGNLHEMPPNRLFLGDPA